MKPLIWENQLTKMKKFWKFLSIGILAFSIASCSDNPNSKNSALVSNSEVNNMDRLKITVGNNELLATLVDNNSTRALKELIKDKPLKVNMSNYGGFEKVGSLGTNLPTNDTQITTTVGDIMLYQGSSIVIFYGSNSWSYTRLGKIENATKESLLNVLGTEEVTITLTLAK